MTSCLLMPNSKAEREMDSYISGLMVMVIFLLPYLVFWRVLRWHDMRKASGVFIFGTFGYVTLSYAYVYVYGCVSCDGHDEYGCVACIWGSVGEVA